MNVYSTWEIVYLGLELKETETSKDGLQFDEDVFLLPLGKYRVDI